MPSALCSKASPRAEPPSSHPRPSQRTATGTHPLPVVGIMTPSHRVGASPVVRGAARGLAPQRSSGSRALGGGSPPHRHAPALARLAPPGRRPRPGLHCRQACTRTPGGARPRVPPGGPPPSVSDSSTASTSTPRPTSARRSVPSHGASPASRSPQTPRLLSLPTAGASPPSPTCARCGPGTPAAAIVRSPCSRGAPSVRRGPSRWRCQAVPNPWLQRRRSTAAPQARIRSDPRAGDAQQTPEQSRLRPIRIRADHVIQCATLGVRGGVVPRAADPRAVLAAGSHRPHRAAARRDPRRSGRGGFRRPRRPAPGKHSVKCVPSH